MMVLNRVGLAALIMVGLVGCSSTSLDEGGSNYSGTNSGMGADGKVLNPLQLLGQLPLPAGAAIVGDRSLIIGSGDNWVGRVVVEVGRDFDAAYRFFLETYPAQGWTVVSAFRGKTSFIVLTRDERTATLEMVDGGMWRTSMLYLTMSPRNAAVMVPK